MAAARAIGDEDSRADTLATLAPHLPAPLLTEALMAAREIENEHARAWALEALAPQLPEAQQSEVLTAALAAARTIENEDDRAWALAALAPHLPQEQQPAVLTKELAVARAMRDESDRLWALAALAPQLTTWGRKDPEAAYLEWTRTLPQLSQCPRPQFLLDIASLMPFTLALADEEAPQAATGISQALQEVCGWWP